MRFCTDILIYIVIYSFQESVQAVWLPKLEMQVVTQNTAHLFDICTRTFALSLEQISSAFNSSFVTSNSEPTL